MGMQFYAICSDCGHEFSVAEGGGFSFHRLTCDLCGKGWSVDYDDLGELHYKYLKGQDVICFGATAEKDRHIQETYPGEAISREEYDVAVEKYVGKCKCGGQYRFKAPTRCPKCRSINVKRDHSKLVRMYD